MNKSIANMNRTIGERELNPTGVKLTKLETLAVELEVAYSLQAQTGWSNIIEKGNDMEAAVLADLVDMLNTDPAHIATTRPQLPPAKINTLQGLADAREHSFNVHYYGNNGLPYFKK